MYYVEIENGKFTGFMTGADQLTDQDIKDSAAAGVNLMLVVEPPFNPHMYDDAADDVERDYGTATAEQIEVSRLRLLYIEQQAYLDSTDWYVLRKVEVDKAIPTEILTKRAKARVILDR